MEIIGAINNSEFILYYIIRRKPYIHNLIHLQSEWNLLNYDAGSTPRRSLPSTQQILADSVSDMDLKSGNKNTINR